MGLPRLLFLVESPFSERDAARFGIDVLSESFDVTVVDATAAVSPSFWRTYHGLQSDDPRVSSVTNEAELEWMFASRAPSAVISNLGMNSFRRKVYALARESGAVTLRFQLGSIPGDVVITESLRKRLAVRVRQLRSPAHLVPAVGRSVARRVLPLPAPDLFVAGGAAVSDEWAARGTRTIHAHSMDVDAYRAAAADPRSEGSPIALYLDQHLGLHSDYEHNGVSRPVDPDHFYPALRTFFGHVTEATGLPVVVALHPRAPRESARERFGDAAIAELPTSVLARRTALFLGHGSTALSYAVLAHRPGLLIGGDELMSSWFGHHVRSFAEALGAPIVTVDAGADAVAAAIQPVDEERYRRYAHDHLTTVPDDPRPTWRIVADELRAQLEQRR
jgi:hypothetical protein